MNQTKKITESEAKGILSLYKDKVVSKASRGAGSALLIDLEQLSITIEWSWRLERNSTIVVGSWSAESDINKVSEILNGLSIIGITFFGRLSEICIEFTNGYWLSSFATAEGDPEWALKYKNSKYMFFKNGQYVVED